MTDLISMTRAFQPDIDCLPRITRFIEECLVAADAGDDDRFAVTLAIDEACTNIITHGCPPAKSTIQITCTADPGSITVEIKDRGREFDPRSAPIPDITSDLAHRRIGGLGVYFIRTLIDGIEYDYRDGTNRLQLVRQRLGEMRE